MIEMGLKNTHTTFDSCVDLAENFDQLCRKFEQEEHISSNAERKTLAHVSDQIEAVKSAHKRLRNFQNHPNFVEPIDDILDHKMISSTCPIVPASKALIPLFSNEILKNAYKCMAYNLNDRRFKSLTHEVSFLKNLEINLSHINVISKSLFQPLVHQMKSRNTKIILR